MASVISERLYGVSGDRDLPGRQCAEIVPLGKLHLRSPSGERRAAFGDRSPKLLQAPALAPPLIN